MNPQDPLAALHPLREPALIGWWPPAPGWWAVLALVIMAISLLAYFLIKRRRDNRYRRLALAQLLALYHDLNQSADGEDTNRDCITAINALLKSVALRAFPRHDIAALSGRAWLDFLNTSRQDTNTATEFSPAFATAAYQRDLPDLDHEQLFQAAKRWIRKHRAPS